MIRDFSKKKDELYGYLDVIDNKEWKSFMVWCGGRAGEFGVWADKLGISSYTRQIDNYQNRVLDTNSRTRNQVDVIFESVAETDRRFAEILRKYAETVKEQIARIQVMTEVMESACGSRLNKETILFVVEQNSVSRREEMLAKGQDILERYLMGDKNISPTEWNKICGIIEEKQPNMLINLYITDCYSSADTEEVYNAIKDYYNRHKMDISIDDVEGLELGDQPLQQIQKETFVECWNYLFAMGLTNDQVIAVIANIHSEGELSPTNRQNTGDNNNIEDPDYVYLIDDNVGYGICQWTTSDRKEGLQNMANEMGKEVSDLGVQLAYFQYEMEIGVCRNRWQTFLSQSSREDAVKIFWEEIEVAQASLAGEGTPIYEEELEKRIGFADDIASWYDITFQEE